MKTIQLAILSIAMGLGFGASALQAQTGSNKFTEQELIAKVVKAPSNPNFFDSTWEQRAQDANDALLRLKKLPSLSTESKAVLLHMVRSSGQPSAWNPFPFYEDQSWDEVQKMLKNYAKTDGKHLPAASQARVLRDQQTMRIIVPICEVLAAHKVQEAVPALIQRYQSGEQHWLKDDMFSALTLFNDPRAIPIMEEYWRKNGNDRDADVDVAIYDIIPTIREYLEGKSKVECATPEETQALNDIIEARAIALRDLLQKSVNIQIEEAFDGEITRRDPTKASYMVFTPAGRWKSVQLPFDSDLQEKTFTKFDEQQGQIGGLRTDLGTTQGALQVAETKIAENSQNIVGIKSNITSLEGRQKELSDNIQAAEMRLNAKIDTTNADVAQTKERLESYTKELNALRDNLAAELSKQDSKVDDKVKALQAKIDGLDSALKSLNQRVKASDVKK